MLHIFKYISVVLLIAILAGAAIGGFHLYRVARFNKKEMEKFSGSRIAYKNNLGKVLVIYYSLSGHTQAIAKHIQQLTDADIYEIKTQEKINTVPWFYLTLRRQLKNKDYPEIKGPLPDLKNYDTVIVGSPVWWYTVATPVLAFLEQTDFQGKRTVPFATQGSNSGTFFEDFQANAKNATLLKGISFNNIPMEENYQKAQENKIADWLNGL